MVALSITELQPGVWPTSRRRLLKGLDAYNAGAALHAPQAGIEEEDFYRDLVDKAAVRCWRLARNHPMLNGGGRG